MPAEARPTGGEEQPRSKLVKSGLVKGVLDLPSPTVKRAMRLFAVTFAKMIPPFALPGLPGQRDRARRDGPTKKLGRHGKQLLLTIICCHGKMKGTCSHRWIRVPPSWPNASGPGAWSEAPRARCAFPGTSDGFWSHHSLACISSGSQLKPVLHFFSRPSLPHSPSVSRHT